MRNEICSDIDADLEATVEKLVREHGYDVVRENLFSLLDQFSWPTVQRILNLAKNIDSRQKRSKSGKRRKSTL